MHVYVSPHPERARLRVHRPKISESRRPCSRDGERKGKEKKKQNGSQVPGERSTMRAYVCAFEGVFEEFLCDWKINIYIDMKQTSRWPLSAIVWRGNRLENEILCTQTSIHNTHQAKRQLRSLVASHITHTSHPTVLGCVTIWANPDRQKCREIWGGRWSRAWASQAVSIYRKRLCCASVWAGACKWVHVQTLSEPTT